LPLLALLLIGVIQVGLMVREQLHLELVTREAARAAARSQNPETAATEIATGLGGKIPAEVTTTILPGPFLGAEMVRVEITITSHSSLPLVSALFSDRKLRATATMAREPP
jgi:hypothetical protein